MKRIILSSLICSISISSMAQCIDKTSFIGRLYKVESQSILFQFTSKDSAMYYAINEFGMGSEKRKATWAFIDDSTIRLTVIRQPESDNADFILVYRPQKDYWENVEFPEAYRRMKSFKSKDLKVKEFAISR